MQSTIYVEMAPGVSIEDLHHQLKQSYEVCPFYFTSFYLIIQILLALVYNNLKYELRICIELMIILHY